MSFEVLANTIAWSLKGAGRRAVSFIWHGGEPTLLPRSFFQKALMLQAEFADDDQLISNQIQTNATRITPDWALFLREYDFSVGVSLDGPAAVHNTHRIDSKGNSTFQEVLNGIEILRKHHVPICVLAVVTDKSLELGAEGFIDFFLENRISNLALNAVMPSIHCSPDTRGFGHYLDPEARNQFYCSLYDTWLKHGCDKIRIREFDAIHNVLIAEQSSLCVFTGDCHGHYFEVDVDGAIAHCDSEGRQEASLGNVLSDSFDDIVFGTRLRNLREKAELERNVMLRCPEFGVCKGWCPQQRLISKPYYSEHDDACCGLSTFIRHIRGRLTSHPDLVARYTDASIGCTDSRDVHEMITF
jgi:uncharacterized protein